MSNKDRKEITRLLKMQIDSYWDGSQHETDIILTIIELKYTLKGLVKSASESYIHLTHPYN